MVDITPIHQKRVFDYAEALELLPVVRRITAEAVARAEALAVRYEALPIEPDAGRALEGELNDVILAWAAKIQRLGAHARGLWLVDFDHERGRYGWRYPDPDLRDL